MKKSIYLLVFITIVQFVASCVCESFYSIYRYSDEITFSVRAAQLKENGSDTIISVLESNSKRTDSFLHISIGLDLDHIEDIPLAHLHSGINKAMASSPCNPEYIVSQDTIVNFDIITLDTMERLMPGESLLHANGFKSYKKDSVINAAIFNRFWLNFKAVDKRTTAHVHFMSWVAFSNGDTLVAEYKFP